MNSPVIIAGAPDGRHQDIGLAADRRQVRRLRMADRHGGVLVQQQHGDGLADDVAAPHHHGALARDRNPAALQKSR